MDEIVIATEEDINWVMETFSSTIYKIAFSQTGNKHDADEVFQEVFLRLIKKTRRFRDEEHVKAWLIKVAINCSKNIFLSLHFKKKAELREDMVDQNFTMEKSEVFYKLMELPQKFRSLLYLFYYEEYTVREISEILGRRESWIKTNMHRGRKMLRKNMEGVEMDG